MGRRPEPGKERIGGPARARLLRTETYNPLIVIIVIVITVRRRQRSAIVFFRNQGP